LICVSPASVAFGQPFAATQAAGPVTTTNATLNGMVTPRGLPTVGWFEWGTDSSYGQTTIPVAVGNGTNVVRVSAPIEELLADSVYRCRLVASNSAGITYGWEHRFTTGCRVASWGDIIFGPSGLVLPPANLGKVVSIGAGDYHGLALKADSTVVSWGRYLSGSVPLSPPAGLSNVLAVAGGSSHTLALKNDGSIVAWGSNSSGQTNVPANLTNAVAISAGDAHGLALKDDGKLSAWGDLGPNSIPAGLSNVVSLSSGDTHWLALRNNGTVVSSKGWVVTFGLSNVVAIAAGYQHDLALKTNGTVVGWGSGAGANVPAGLSNVVQIAAGDAHSLALRNDGTLVVWGSSVAWGATNLPTGLHDVAEIVCGDEFCMALVGQNTPPQARPRTLTVPVNLDTVLALSAAVRDPNGDALSCRIISPPSLGSLFQFVSGQRGAAITATNTLVSDTTNRVIFVPGQQEFGAPYMTFNVVASDGEFESAPSLVTVNVVPSPSVTIVGPNQNSNGVTLSFTGLSNATYFVLYSADLTNWSNRGPASQPAPGHYFYYDSTATIQPRRFFRVRSP